MKTVRRPPYPKWNPGYFPCSSLTPLPLSSRRPSVSFGGFGLSGTLAEPYQFLNFLQMLLNRVSRDTPFTTHARHPNTHQHNIFLQLALPFPIPLPGRGRSWFLLQPLDPYCPFHQFFNLRRISSICIAGDAISAGRLPPLTGCHAALRTSVLLGGVSPNRGY